MVKIRLTHGEQHVDCTLLDVQVGRHQWSMDYENFPVAVRSILQIHSCPVRGACNWMKCEDSARVLQSIGAIAVVNGDRAYEFELEGEE
jgi:hypothetical protein